MSRVFRQTGKLKKIKQWEVWVEENILHMKSGYVGYKMKHTWTGVKSVGKKGTKSYVPSDEQAVLEMGRKITKKMEVGGYREVDSKTGSWLVEEAAASDSFGNFKSLPTNYAEFKPQQKLDEGTKKEKMVIKLANDEDRGIITIKEDGQFYYVLITPTGRVRIYTRRMEEQTEHFPFLKKSFENMKFPPATVIGCESVCYHPKSGRASLQLMQSLSRSLPERAQAIQEDPLRRPTAIVLRISVLGGERLIQNWNVNKWIGHITKTVSRARNPYIKPMEIFYGNFKDAVKYVKETGVEGLVIYDGDAVYGERALNFRGEPERPECWKWKPSYEDDFIIMFKPDEKAGRFGKGRLKDLPGQYQLWQWERHPSKKDAELVYICNCGSGSDEQRRQIMSKAAASPEGVAGVGIVKYVNRYYMSEGEQSNALREPVFVDWHPDKDISEAVNTRLIDLTVG